MCIIDRYLLRLFVKVLLISLSSLTGIYFVVDTFTNLDEFVRYGNETQGGLLAVLRDYYSPRILETFNYIGALLALIAAMFAIAWLRRSNELTALLAAGIPQSRVLRPLILAALVVSAIGVAVREFGIPQVRAELSRNAQNWQGTVAKPVRPRYDNETGIQINGRSALIAKKEIVKPKFRLPGDLAESFGRYLQAETAHFQAPTEGRRSGYLLTDVSKPENFSEMPPIQIDNQTVIFTPTDATWLKKNQCFVVSNVNFEQIASGAKWRDCSSTAELIQAIHNPSLEFGADVRVTIHSRFIRPFLDMTLIFLGLPLVASRQPPNIFFAAGKCLFLVSALMLITLVCHSMGNNGYLITPAMAAWLPLMIFAPIAYATSANLRE